MATTASARTALFGSLAVLLATSATSAACGKTADVADPADTPAPPGADGAIGTDSAAPGSDAASNGDAAVTDAADGGADAQPFACAECKPDFCGCGACTAAQVVCTKTPKPCPLGCATSCDLSQFACACAGDRCVHVPPSTGDVACYATGDCPVGQCCEIGNALVGKCRIGNDCAK